MKSPHLLSIVHDLAIRPRSAQSPQKEKISPQLRLSSHSTRPSRIMTAFPTNHALSVLADTHEATIGIPLCSYLPGQVLDPFTTSPTEPSVVHVCTITSPEIHLTTIALHPIVSAATTISHTNTQRPYQQYHSCVLQCCRARLHVATLGASC